MHTTDAASARLWSLHLEGIKAPEIATTLNAEGYRTIRNIPFSNRLINLILYRFRTNSRSRYTVALKRAGATNGN